jgi:uncharacterized protein
MTVEIVSQESILDKARGLVDSAKTRVWITAPWVTASAASALLDGLSRRIVGDGLDVRLVYRLKGTDDLTISDLSALDRLEAAGAQIRFSDRLHAKVILVDDHSAIVSSSNLTSTAGFSRTTGNWQNQELGTALLNEPELAAEVATEFERIWATSRQLTERTLGIVLSPTAPDRIRVACLRDPILGEYVTIGSPPIAVGQVVEASAINMTVPSEISETDVQMGLRGGGGGARSRVPDVETLFSHPSKTHALLMAQTFVRSEAAYRVADIAILRSITPQGFAPVAAPLPPGELAERASAEVLRALISGESSNQITVGVLAANADVSVAVDVERLLTLHLAVLGMTGSGKSNALKVLIEELLKAELDLRIVIVDTHGEYGYLAEQQERQIDARFFPCLEDESWVRRAARTGSQTSQVMDIVSGILDMLGDDATSPAVASELYSAAEDATKTLKPRLERLAAAITGESTLRLREADAAELALYSPDGDEEPFTLDAPGLYRMDLRLTHRMEDRAKMVEILARRTFAHAKLHNQAHPMLFVIDEAQNYAPEQSTGRLGALRSCFDAIFDLAAEGRKFRCGLVVATQRPARVNNDILSQCNTQILFRMVNPEDLGAVRQSFESTSEHLLAQLPGLSTGTGFVAGAALASPAIVAFRQARVSA